MTDHDRFEALAGAVVLGEATEAERARFDEHALACDACRTDVAGMPVVRDALDRARGAETWRPSIDDAVSQRIHASRRSRFRVTIGALGWAVAMSIVLNVAIVSGLSAHIHDAFSSDREATSDVTAMKIDFEKKAPTGPVASVAVMRPKAIAPIERHRTKRHASVAAEPAHVARIATDPAATVAVPSSDDVPDVLAGLDIDGTSHDGAKHVAVQPRCEASSRPAGDGTDTPPEPCANATDVPH